MEEKNPQIWIDFKSTGLRKPSNFCKGALPQNTPAGAAYSTPQTPQLNIAC